MRGLTLWRPWPWAILHCPSTAAVGPKRVENRPFPPPAVALGEPIALHAGKVYDHDAVVFMRSLEIECPRPEALAPREPGGVPRPVHPEGRIVGLARVRGYIEGEAGELRRFAGVTREVALQAQASPWFFGPFGWLLTDVVALPRPVLHRGAQGLFGVESGAARDVLDQVRQLKASAGRQRLDDLGELLDDYAL